MYCFDIDLHRSEQHSMIRMQVVIDLNPHQLLAYTKKSIHNNSKEIRYTYMLVIQIFSVASSVDHHVVRFTGSHVATRVSYNLRTPLIMLNCCHTQKVLRSLRTGYMARECAVGFACSFALHLAVDFVVDRFDWSMTRVMTSDAIGGIFS